AKSDVAGRDLQLPRAPGDPRETWPHRERGRDPHPGARGLRHAAVRLPRAADSEGGRVGGAPFPSVRNGVANKVIAELRFHPLLTPPHPVIIAAPATTHRSGS